MRMRIPLKKGLKRLSKDIMIRLSLKRPRE
jgi:hypothetical protein